VRIIWAGLLAWILCAFIFFAVKYFKTSVGTVPIRKMVLSVSVVLIGIGLVFTQWNAISAHLLEEKVVVQKVLTRNFENMPVTSFGSRTYIGK
jgi:hypothetical protein